jgi:hypothetical protein
MKIVFKIDWKKFPLNKSYKKEGEENKKELAVL